MEIEVDSTSEAAAFAEGVLSEAVPKLQELLQMPETGDRYQNAVEVLKACT